VASRLGVPLDDVLGERPVHEVRLDPLEPSTAADGEGDDRGTA
jgi:hypothetical protein